MSNGDAGPAQPGPFDVIPSRPVFLPKPPPSSTPIWPCLLSTQSTECCTSRTFDRGWPRPHPPHPACSSATYTDLTGCAHCHDHSSTSDTRLLCKHARTHSLLGGVLAVSWMLAVLFLIKGELCPVSLCDPPTTTTTPPITVLSLGHIICRIGFVRERCIHVAGHLSKCKSEVQC